MAKTIGDLTNNAMLDRQNWAAQGLQNFGAAMNPAWQTANLGNQALSQIGGNYEQLMANQIQDQNRIFDQTQQKPWDALAQYNAIMSGSGQLGSKGSSTVTSPTTPMWQQMAGFGLGALGTMAPGGIM